MRIKEINKIKAAQIDTKYCYKTKSKIKCASEYYEIYLKQMVAL